MPRTGTAAAPEVSVNVVAVRVAGSIGSLNVALACPFMETPLAPLTGLTERTVGVVAIDPRVVKVQERLAASATPVELRAPVVIVAVYDLSPSSGTAGENVAVEPA